MFNDTYTNAPNKTIRTIQIKSYDWDNTRVFDKNSTKNPCTTCKRTKPHRVKKTRRSPYSRIHF